MSSDDCDRSCGLGTVGPLPRLSRPSAPFRPRLLSAGGALGDQTGDAWVFEKNQNMPVTTASSKPYFVLHDGVDEVTRAVADSKPDQRGLQELLL